MNDEQIKEITLAVIEKGQLYLDGNDNAEVAKSIAAFIKTLREETYNG